MTWTTAILISAVVLLTAAGFMLRRQRLDTLVFRAGRIRLVRSHPRMRQSRRICDAKIRNLAQRSRFHFAERSLRALGAR
jgi:hypothetical protein